VGELYIQLWAPSVVVAPSIVKRKYSLLNHKMHNSAQQLYINILHSRLGL